MTAVPFLVDFIIDVTEPSSEWTPNLDPNMLGYTDQGFVDINAIALNAAISGSILAVPDACLVMMMALPFGSTPALPTDQATLPPGPGLPYASLRSAHSLANAVASVDLRTPISSA
jgi:hypothetical protein